MACRQWRGATLSKIKKGARGWRRGGRAEDYAPIQQVGEAASPPNRPEINGRSKNKKGAGRGCGWKPDQQRPQQIVSGTKSKAKTRENRSLLESPSSSSHRRAGLDSKSVRKTHHGGGLCARHSSPGSLHHRPRICTRALQMEAN